jgi:hypothetical protein
MLDRVTSHSAEQSGPSPMAGPRKGQRAVHPCSKNWDPPLRHHPHTAITRSILSPGPPLPPLVSVTNAGHHLRPLLQALPTLQEEHSRCTHDCTGPLLPSSPRPSLFPPGPLSLCPPLKIAQFPRLCLGLVSASLHSPCISHCHGHLLGSPSLCMQGTLYTADAQ